jgi:hypothetical protein
MRYVSLSDSSERSERQLLPAREKYVPRHELNRRSDGLKGRGTEIAVGRVAECGLAHDRPYDAQFGDPKAMTERLRKHSSKAGRAKPRKGLAKSSHAI